MKTDVPAKKSLGQNWLVNEGVLNRIVEAAHVGHHDAVLEIGPGRGVLTKRLAVSGARVIAVEKDSRLIGPLKEQFAAFTNVEIVEADALSFLPKNWKLETGNWKLIANIPYYLTSHLIRLALESWKPSEAILMVQLEVARRLMAKPPDMNLLALSVQLYAEPSLVMRVSRGSFRPVPDVDSAVVRLALRTPPPDAAAVMAAAKRAFAQKRKQLKSVLSAETLAESGIPPTARPQELSVDDWRRIVAFQ